MVMIRAALPQEYWNSVTIRILERESIREFMEQNREYLRGRVLDWGCGKQPYRDLVEGEYLPFDQRDYPLDWRHSEPDSIMCNQVLQYIEYPELLLLEFAHILPSGGHLVMTYTTCWALVEGDDPEYFRFTPNGIEHMLKAAGFEVLIHEERAKISLGKFDFSLGGGVVARKV